MEEEYIRYRQASFKGKLLIAKRFTKFYLTKYQPITQLEANDLQRAKYQHNAYTLVGAFIFGFLSLRIRRARSGALETAGVSRENHLPLYMLNDLMWGFVGYCSGMLLSADYIYKHR